MHEAAGFEVVVTTGRTSLLLTRKIPLFTYYDAFYLISIHSVSISYPRDSKRVVDVVADVNL